MLKHDINRIKRKWIDGILLRGWRFHAQSSIIIETSNICNLKCQCCPNGLAPEKLRPKGTMSKETFDILIKNLDMPVKQCFLHMCGEPFLNKNLVYFAKQLINRHIVPIIFSNGYQIDYKQLDELLNLKGIKIAFSMDLLSKKHYEDIRFPGKYEKCKESLRHIDQIFSNKKRFYGLNIIIDSSEIREIDKVCSGMFEEYSNLYQITLSSMWPWPDYPQSGDIAGHIAHYPKICNRVKDMPAILWNGDVSFCSFDYSGELIVGNILNEAYSKIFNGKKTRRIRRHLLTGNTQKETLCKNCLLPRYESYNSHILKTKYMKMSQDDRLRYFDKLKNYYNIIYDSQKRTINQ